MTLITRYVVEELLKIFSFTLFGFTGLMMLIGVGQEAVNMQLGLLPTFRLIPFLLPTALAFAVPASILFAVCLVYGRLSSDNEIIAAKSLGISPFVLLRPGLVLAFLLSLVAVWLNDIAFSWGYAGVQRVVIQSVEEIAYGMLKTQRSYQNDRFSIHVSHVEGRRLMNPVIKLRINESTLLNVVAAEAELKSDLSKGTLSLKLIDSEYEAGNGIKGYWPTEVFDIPLAFASSKGQGPTSPANLPLRQIAGEMKSQDEKIEQSRLRHASEVAFFLSSGNVAKLDDPSWNARREEVRKGVSRMHRLRTEPWRRYASGFSCLCFVLIGAPLAVRLRNSDYMTTFGICFLPILIFYYPLLAYGLDQAKSGELPPYVVWLANVVCGAIGLWQLRFVQRY
ncbi:MAG: LptF/LptG family permease [Planctomycetaceae bacterium]